MHHSPPRLHYTGLPLRRIGGLGKNRDWVHLQFNAPAARYLLLHDQRNLLSSTQPGAEPLFLGHDQCAPFLENGDRTPLLLGMQGDEQAARPVLALDVSDLDQGEVEASSGGLFVDLRRVGAHIDPPTGSLLGFARGLLHWHGNHGFCPHCGQRTHIARGGHSRVCSNESCAREYFPRIDPAVIMLVEYQPESGPALCLLGRNHRFTNGMFSTLAGYVDAGESLEEAVRREVYEEAGIHTFDERYIASQPWPFPGSIMLGFRASARNTDIRIEEDEIAEADWFSADDLRAFGEFSDQGNAPKLPRRDSIARYLIDLWLAEKR